MIPVDRKLQSTIAIAIVFASGSQVAAGQDLRTIWPSLPQAGMIEAKCAGPVNRSSYNIAYGQKFLSYSRVENDVNTTEFISIDQNASYRLNGATGRWKPTGGIMTNKRLDPSMLVMFSEIGGRLHFDPNSIIGIDTRYIMAQPSGDDNKITETRNYIYLEVQGKIQRCLNVVTWTRRSTASYWCDGKDQRPEHCPYRPQARYTDCGGDIVVQCTYENVESRDPNTGKALPEDRVERPGPAGDAKVEEEGREKVPKNPAQSDNAVSSKSHTAIIGLLTALFVLVVIACGCSVIVVLVMRGVLEQPRFINCLPRPARFDHRHP